MPKRTIKDYLIVALKGVAMGAADVVPGVSGGTIAFISGIYEELIETIHKLDLGFFGHWRHQGFVAAWKHYNLSFLAVLLLGILGCILSLARLISWLRANHPVMVWAFFFGLVLASVIYVGREVSRWRPAVVVALLAGAGIAYFITLAKPLGTVDNNWFLLLAGFVAIIAMILPGISGAFILLLMGAYSGVIGTVSGLGEAVGQGNWSQAGAFLVKLGIFAIGAILGLKVFSGALNWMFKHYRNTTLALLTGFMIGALNKIWPWKEVLSTRINHKGEEVPLLEKSVWPSDFSGEPLILWALILAAAGFVLIFALEYLAKGRKHENV